MQKKIVTDINLESTGSWELKVLFLPDAETFTE